MDDRRRVVNFDRLARPYRWLEYVSFGPMLMRCRCEYMPAMVTCSHALVLGDGDGRFLSRLLADALELSADVIDSSEAMLRILSCRVAHIEAPGHCPATSRITLYPIDARAFQPRRRKYDLVVAHFFLDCFDEGDLSRIIKSIAVSLVPGALLVVSEFAIPVTSETSSRRQKLISLTARELVRLLYSVFGLATGLRVHSLPDYSDALRRHGFHRKACHTRLAGLVVSELWTFDSGAGEDSAIRCAG